LLNPSTVTGNINVTLTLQSDRFIVIAFGLKNAVSFSLSDVNDITRENDDPESWETTSVNDWLLSFLGTIDQPIFTATSGQTVVITDECCGGGSPTSKIKFEGAYEPAEVGLQYANWSLDASTIWIDVAVKVSPYDVTPPEYSNNQTNTTIAGTSANFTLNWIDNVELSGYIFSTNNSGTWINSSYVSFSGTSNISWNVTTLDNTIGTLVQWCYYANDTYDNWNRTSCDNPFELITTTATTTTIPLAVLQEREELQCFKNFGDYSDFPRMLMCGIEDIFVCYKSLKNLNPYYKVLLCLDS